MIENLGVDQQIGIGKNYHTLDPEPTTWEDYPGLSYSINSEVDGQYYAAVTVEKYPDLSTPTRTFADEATAMAWVRNQYEMLHRKLMNVDA